MTTFANERIQVFDASKQLIDVFDQDIIQRHWLQNELIEAGKIVGFKMSLTKLAESEEKYVVMSKVGDRTNNNQK